jgi:hypothetical protein
MNPRSFTAFRMTKVVGWVEEAAGRPPEVREEFLSFNRTRRVRGSVVLRRRVLILASWLLFSAFQNFRVSAF